MKKIEKKKLKLLIKKCRYIMAKSVIRLSGVTLINGSDFDGYGYGYGYFFSKMI